jgi:hypothetical protein
MFGSYNVFDMFSRFRIRESYSYSEQESTINQDKSPLTIDAPVTNTANAAQELLPVTKTTPTDTVDISNKNTTAPKKETPVTYAPKVIKTDDDDSKADTAEKTDSDSDAKTENQLLSSKTAAKIDLKMVFNLSDFQSLVSAVAEDAQDGQLDTSSYSNLNLGFHSNLDARAMIKETYKTADGQNPADISQVFKNKEKYSNLEASMIKNRGFEAASFYRESMNTSSKIKTTYRNGFLNVARKLSVRYSQDFHLNMKTMNQFNSQSEALDKTGDLQAYLGNTEALVDSSQSSGELIGKFFDTVDTYLSGAEDKLVSKVEDFMDNLATEMGIDKNLLSGAKDSLVSSIHGFFDKVDLAISVVKNNYMPQQAQPAVTDTPEVAVPTPELADTSEAVAAT